MVESFLSETEPSRTRCRCLMKARTFLISVVNLRGREPEWDKAEYRRKKRFPACCRCCKMLYGNGPALLFPWTPIRLKLRGQHWMRELKLSTMSARFDGTRR